mgnify:CR=1 FL=1
MALSATPAISLITSRMIKQTTVTNTTDNNVTGTNATIHVLDLNNTHSATGYFKIFDNGNPVYGTTTPDIVIPVAASLRQVVTIVEGITTSTAISWGVSDGAGTTAGGALSGGAFVVVGMFID